MTGVQYYIEKREPDGLWLKDGLFHFTSIVKARKEYRMRVSCSRLAVLRLVKESRDGAREVLETSPEPWKPKEAGA